MRINNFIWFAGEVPQDVDFLEEKIREVTTCAIITMRREKNVTPENDYVAGLIQTSGDGEVLLFLKRTLIHYSVGLTVLWESGPPQFMFYSKDKKEEGVYPLEINYTECKCTLVKKEGGCINIK